MWTRYGTELVLLPLWICSTSYAMCMVLVDESCVKVQYCRHSMHHSHKQVLKDTSNTSNIRVYLPCLVLSFA